VVTNTALGADEIIIGKNDPFPYAGSCWKDIEEFSLKVALALEACFGMHGEIGLDVGIDEHGKLWLIEANSKPNTRGYKEVTSPEVSSLVYGLPLDYAKFLARRMFVLSDF